MSIKSIALAAATIAALGSTASAGNYFEAGSQLQAGPELELGLVHADANGTVEIYSKVGSDKGSLIGSKDVLAGANGNVTVDVNSVLQQDVVAVLKVNGQIVAEHDYNIVR
ncbi:hypothetical protein SAMN04488005_2870 [Yoonia tamlensis]|uniref:Uncharacterized protein n=1 Tax=Yoonia tamlensis TaxID=390270 RepID=A0A1I6HMY4_9RHOB|nr:hypothetical protein [Yoonia tamlensis]SFR55802.1 hypothetical protein SAMN04488005_2870 [Yoonia tamlensis]